MKVTLKSLVGDITISTSADDPNLKNLQVNTLTWDKSNNWTLAVPTRVSYKNTFGNEILVFENLAEHLVNSTYDLNPSSETYKKRAFEIVGVDQDPVLTVKKEKAVEEKVVIPKADETPIVVDENDKPKGRNKKEKKDEENT